MERLVKIGKVCDHFHLSLQSGSDRVLQRMNRKYSTREYGEIVEIIRKHMPQAGITTDIIVGFPEETEEEFEDTLDFVKKIGFSRIHVFKYSPRVGTPAAEYKEQINGNIKNQRSETLISLGDEMMKEFNNEFIGKGLSVLFEEESRDGQFIEGYTTNYIRVKSKLDKAYLGQIADVRINSQEEDYLIGDIID